MVSKREGPHIQISITCRGCAHRKDHIIQLGRGDEDNDPTCLRMNQPLQRYAVGCGDEPRTPDWCPYLKDAMANAGVVSGAS